MSEKKECALCGAEIAGNKEYCPECEEAIMLSEDEEFNNFDDFDLQESEEEIPDDEN